MAVDPGTHTVYASNMDALIQLESRGLVIATYRRRRWRISERGRAVATSKRRQLT
ncbi:hypothetical protein ACQP1O_18835 [Nocardia sp. CA-151230]|uniref:hypothetical protein n=1 Tax=Nocardia sp. CA-151230 TaxID=3239982 RepID=UPI003D936C72